MNQSFIDNERVVPLNIGAWCERKQLNYDIRSGGSGNTIVESGRHKVICDALDSLIEIQPTFIKMDIEGAEMEALEGAKRRIMNGTPKLAICVYHKAEDIWKIPLWIHQLVPDYKLYLRHHNDDYEETVIYATR